VVRRFLSSWERMLASAEMIGERMIVVRL